MRGMYADTTFVSGEVDFVCPATGDGVTAEFSEADLRVNSAPCEVCGSHTQVWVSVSCPSCGGLHEVSLRDD